MYFSLNLEPVSFYLIRLAIDFKWWPALLYLMFQLVSRVNAIEIDLNSKWLKKLSTDDHGKFKSMQINALLYQNNDIRKLWPMVIQLITT